LGEELFPLVPAPKPTAVIRKITAFGEFDANCGALPPKSLPFILSIMNCGFIVVCIGVAHELHVIAGNPVFVAMRICCAEFLTACASIYLFIISVL